MFSKSNSSPAVRKDIIEINLVPDVKQELIKAQMLRSRVIASSILVSIAVGVVVVMMVMTAFVGQAAYIMSIDKDINKQFSEYKNYKGVNQIITIQKQLSQIDQTHAAKPILSRVFALLVSVTQSTNNAVKISKINYDVANKTIIIEGQSTDGYTGLDKLSKSIEMTELEYTDKSNQLVTKEIASGEVYNVDPARYSEKSGGEKVLMFKIGFVPVDDIFANIGTELILRGPGRTDVTDSTIAIPSDIFAAQEPIKTTEGEQR